jgi:hypothetical protein
MSSDWRVKQIAAKVSPLFAFTPAEANRRGQNATPPPLSLTLRRVDTH